MASPTKNFIDPTGFSRIALHQAPIVDTTFDIRTSVLFGIPKVIVYSDIDIVSFNKDAMAVVNPTEAQVPRPPVGRMLISTFPPIYRERGSIKRRPTRGQLWPLTAART